VKVKLKFSHEIFRATAWKMELSVAQHERYTQHVSASLKAPAIPSLVGVTSHYPRRAHTHSLSENLFATCCASITQENHFSFVASFVECRFRIDCMGKVFSLLFAANR